MWPGQQEAPEPGSVRAVWPEALLSGTPAQPGPFSSQRPPQGLLAPCTGRAPGLRLGALLPIPPTPVKHLLVPSISLAVPFCPGGVLLDPTSAPGLWSGPCQSCLFEDRLWPPGQVSSPQPLWAQLTPCFLWPIQNQPEGRANSHPRLPSARPPHMGKAAVE